MNLATDADQIEARREREYTALRACAARLGIELEVRCPPGGEPKFVPVIPVRRASEQQAILRALKDAADAVGEAPSPMIEVTPREVPPEPTTRNGEQHP